MAKLTSEKLQGMSSFLIDLLTAFDIFFNWMFLSFVSFITSCGFLLTFLENIVYDEVSLRHDDFKDDVGVFFWNSNFRSEGRELMAGTKGWGPRKTKTIF